MIPATITQADLQVGPLSCKMPASRCRFGNDALFRNGEDKRDEVDVQSVLHCSPEAVWAEVQKSSLLLEVVRPFVTLRPAGASAFPSDGSATSCIWSAPAFSASSRWEHASSTSTVFTMNGGRSKPVKTIRWCATGTT